MESLPMVWGILSPVIFTAIVAVYSYIPKKEKPSQNKQ